MAILIHLVILYPERNQGSRAITDFQEEMWDEYRDDYPIATGEGITGIGITLE